MTKPPAARAFLDEEQQPELGAKLFAKLRADGREPLNLHLALGAAPELCTLVIDFAYALRTSTLISPLDRELVLLRSLQLESGEYEFELHAENASKHGMTRDQIADLHVWRDSDQFDEAQKAVLAYADALATRSVVPDEVYDRLAAFYGPRQIVELTLAAGFYIMIARITHGLKVSDDQ